MNITNLILGIYLILFGLVQMGVIAVSGTILGILALIAGVGILVVGLTVGRGKTV